MKKIYYLLVCLFFLQSAFAAAWIHTLKACRCRIKRMFVHWMKIVIGQDFIVKASVIFHIPFSF